MAIVQQIVNKAMIFALSRATASKIGVQSKEFRDLFDTVAQANTDSFSYDMNEVFTSVGAFYAPVIYTNVHENEHLNASLFTVKANNDIPLHDHPGMFGISKVIHGKIRITSYTYLTPTQQDQLKEQWTNRSGGQRIGKLFRQPLNRWEERHVLPVVRNNDLTLTPADPPSMLTPAECNIHHVQALDDHAVFFDVLMPPYYPSAGRDCHYFQTLDAKEKLLVDAEPSQRIVRSNEEGEQRAAESPSSQSEVAWLWRIPAPRSYYCDTVEYRGPFAKSLTEAELRAEMKAGYKVG